MMRLEVALGQRSYPIAIGSGVLARAGELVPWHTKRAVVVTNTMPIPEEKRFGKLKVLSIAPLIADALRAVFEESSVSEIFHGENQ